MRIDLHCHSHVSDGTQPPEDVVRRAHAAGLDVVALTDHDTTGGWAEASAALPEGMTLLRGAELSCRHRDRSLHLLAYRFDPDHPELSAELERVRNGRVLRAQATVRRLQEMGAPVTWEAVRALAGGEAVGRPHIAQAMVDAGVITTVEEAFTAEWIGADGRARVERYALDPLQAVRLVKAAGGVAVLAHARAARRGYLFEDELIEELAAEGLGGLEVDHPDHGPADRAHLRLLAKSLGLAVTGGSDDHGRLTGHRLGCETTDPQEYARLVAG